MNIREAKARLSELEPKLVGDAVVRFDEFETERGTLWTSARLMCVCDAA